MNPLDVAVHLQDNNLYCGQACAQMVTRFLAASLQPQSAFASGHASIPPWATTPDQLADMLNQFLPASHPPYVVFAAPTADQAMAHALASVDHAAAGRWPAVALTDGGEHWEVITGFTYGKPAHPAVHLRNPAPDRTLLFLGAPPGHQDTDACDTLNIVTNPGPTPTAPDDEVLSWTAWKTIWFTRCDAPGGSWQNRFVIVAPVPPGQIAVPVVGPAPPYTPGGVAISESESNTYAWSGLDQSELLQQPRWRDSLAGLSRHVAYPARLVNFLDDSGGYYLVALTDANGGGALVGVDAGSGDLLWARLNPTRVFVDRLFTAISAVREGLHLPDDQAVGRIVWRPSLASFYSPYFPLVEFSGPNTAPFYVRLFDGRRIETMERALYFGA